MPFMVKVVEGSGVPIPLHPGSHPGVTVCPRWEEVVPGQGGGAPPPVLPPPPVPTEDPAPGPPVLPDPLPPAIHVVLSPVLLFLKIIGKALHVNEGPSLFSYYHSVCIFF